MNTLTHVMQETAQRLAQAPAVRDAEQVLDWAGFQDRVGRVAGLLRARGLRRGQRFAVLALNSFRFADLLHAGWRLGATPVPLNHRLSPLELADILQQSDCRQLVADPALAAILQAPAMAVWPARTLWLDAAAYESLLAAATPAQLAPLAADQVQPADEALLLFTGGTSGRAKGVPLSHANILANARQIASVLRPAAHDVVLHVAPMFHAAELVFTCFVLRGAAQAYLPRFTAQAFLQAVALHRVTTTLLVPTMLTLLLDSGLIGQHDTSSLRRVVYGASPIPRETIERAMHALPHVHFIQGYGLTETSPLLAMLDFAAHRAALAGRHTERLGACGRALPGVQLRVVADDGAVLPTGEVGEIVAQGDNVFAGYLDAPELSRRALRGGWFHTGDVGLVDSEGYVFILDRKKDVIITGGEKVYSGEVEAVLLQHPGVLEVAVVGRPDALYGEAVHAVVVLRPHQAPDAQALQAFCRDRIGGYKAPRSISFADRLPRTALGKVLKTQLRQALADVAA